MFKQEGFSFNFDSSKCFECGGKCCRGESGNIWVDEEEIVAIAKFLNVTKKELAKGCLKEVGSRISIKDISCQNERVCFFFDMEKLNCSIYDVRPKQCRTFPFWDSFKNNIKDLEEECPAIII